MKNIFANWNLIDTCFYKLDTFYLTIKELLSDREPDVELIIESETDYLKKENETLKELQYPRKLKSNENKNYICPNKRCGISISALLVENYRIKFCPECGQRIFADNYKKIED